MPHSPGNSRVALVPSRIASFFLEPDPRVATGLLLAIIALLPAEPLFNVPMIALAVLGLVQVASRRARLASPEYRFLCIAFLCIWAPMVASLPDAVNPGESIRKTASICIYFLAGVYVAGAYTRFREVDWLLTGVVALLVFFYLDALWQFQFGTDWFGIPYEEGGRVTGALRTGRIGSLLAGFAPFYFEMVRRASRRWRLSPVLLLPFLVTIFLSGSRTAWGALAVASAGYLLFLFRWSDSRFTVPPKLRLGRFAGISGALVLAVAITAFAWPNGVERVWKATEHRVESLSGIWSGDRAKFERAVTWRLSIWETAVNMWSVHWLNGVGPLGFRAAYRDYNPERDYYHEFLEETGQGHLVATSPRSPHLPLFEIATGTGVIGLLGYVILAVYFFRRLRRLEPDAFQSTFPYALALIVALFPLNGHIEFFSLYYVTLIWWTIIVNACAFAVASGQGATANPAE